ncbi:hypothetical protein HDU99_000731, partial [Rhizoclosmatium hyalinum]
LQINNAAVAPVPVPPPAHPPSRQIIHDHIVQVSHGHMRQINGSKLSEKREEVFRDNDHCINFAYDGSLVSMDLDGQAFPVRILVARVFSSPTSKVEAEQLYETPAG